jgi:hypothetical protein
MGLHGLLQGQLYLSHLNPEKKQKNYLFACIKAQDTHCGFHQSRMYFFIPWYYNFGNSCCNKLQDLLQP